MKRVICTLLLVLMLLALAACAGNAAQAGSSDTAPSGELTVRGITVVREPQVTYMEGESFDPSDAVVNAVMSDGSIVEGVPFQVEVNDPLTRTTVMAKLSYEGKEATVMLHIFIPGNNDEYSVEQTEMVPDSPLAGKTVFWLGSSVTDGASSGHESMADFIAKKHGASCIKEAVSGTTLRVEKPESYVERLDAYLSSPNRAAHVDAVVCQLSTNDRNSPELFGEVTGFDVRDITVFDTATTFGAMEYIIAESMQTWGCPVLFYTNAYFYDTNYEKLVDGLGLIALKWGVTVVDLYQDKDFNDITEEDRALFMADKIHPSKAGYREWWLPKFEQALEKAMAPA